MMKKTYSALTKLIKENGNFPNNAVLPVLVYKKILKKTTPESVQTLFRKNQWDKAWVDKIYSFHHFHSNTHEVLGICNGKCDVELGGPNGFIIQIEKGDVLILPAGVSHKNIASTEDLVVVGAYPENTIHPYNMRLGKAGERPKVDVEISSTIVPSLDPVLGNDGLVFDHWKK